MRLLRHKEEVEWRMALWGAEQVMLRAWLTHTWDRDELDEALEKIERIIDRIPERRV